LRPHDIVKRTAHHDPSGSSGGASIPLTVPRVVFPSRQQVVVDTVEIPDAKPNQIRARATRTLVSAGTERNVFERAGPQPRQPGYSWVGVVDQVGADVAGYRPGALVTQQRHQGAVLITIDSGVGDSEGYAGRIPASVSDELATFAVLGDVALHGVRRAGPSLGDAVAVFGQGVVGQLVTQFARLAGGYPVIAVDLDDDRLAKARLSGATHTVNAARANAAEAIRALTDGEGARMVFMVTRTPRILPECLLAAAPGGTVCLTGSPPGTVEIRLQEELLRKELRIIGTHQARYPRTPYHMFAWTRAANRAYILGLLERGELRLEHLISHRVSYRQAPEMYRMIEAGPAGWLAIVLDWTE